MRLTRKQVEVGNYTDADIKADWLWAVEALAGQECPDPVEPDPGTEGWLPCGKCAVCQAKMAGR